MDIEFSNHIYKHIYICMFAPHSDIRSTSVFEFESDPISDQREAMQNNTTQFNS